MLSRFMLLPTLGLFVGSAYGQIEVRLKEFAEAQSRQVRLSDIATLDAPDVAGLPALGETTVATVTHVNRPLRIEASRVMQIIVRQQPALAGKLRFAGAPATSVVLPGEALPSERVTSAASAFLQAELARHPGRFSIRDARIERGPLMAPKGELQFKFRLSGSSMPASRMTVVVDLFVNTKRVDSIPVIAEVDAVIPVLRLTHSMTAGATLNTRSYEVVEQPIDRFTRMASLLNAKTDLSMLRLRRDLPANALLYREDVERVPDVTRHQPVLAELKSNGIVIEKTVVAQTDGQLGQTIRVADSRSAEIYSTKVVGHGRVEVK